MPYSFEEGRYIHSFPELPHFEIERNLLTFAASRSGKGATQIIPFLLQNKTTNVLVIDPKGEAAEATVESRREAGQDVFLLDPFKTSDARASYRQFNFLAEIDPDDPNSFRQINALADGLIMRHDPKGGHWDGGGMQVLAGFIAHVLTAPEFEGKRSLVTVRELLKMTDGETFTNLLYDMAENTACGKLPIAAADRLLNTGKEAGHFRSVATANTAWIDDPHMSECLSRSDFKLSDLKRKDTDIFLVLPLDALDNYGVFLRLFVRMALYHMQQKLPNGELKGRECYFILDEFFSLGHLEPIEKGMGAMPGYNLRLWPFLQDINQLVKLYGQIGTGTFFSNSDAVYFFGTNDVETARMVSGACGLITENDIGVKAPAAPSPEAYEFHTAAHHPPTPPTPMQSQNDGIFAVVDMVFNGIAQASYESSLAHHQHARARLDQIEKQKQATFNDQMNDYSHAKATVGHPRVSPEQVMEITKRNPDRKIADQAIVIREGIGYLQNLRAYFEKSPSTDITGARWSESLQRYLYEGQTEEMFRVPTPAQLEEEYQRQKDEWVKNRQGIKTRNSPEYKDLKSAVECYEQYLKNAYDLYEPEAVHSAGNRLVYAFACQSDWHEKDVEFIRDSYRDWCKMELYREVLPQFGAKPDWVL